MGGRVRFEDGERCDGGERLGDVVSRRCQVLAAKPLPQPLATGITSSVKLLTGGGEARPGTKLQGINPDTTMIPAQITSRDGSNQYLLYCHFVHNHL